MSAPVTMAHAFLFANADHRIPAHPDAAFLFPPFAAADFLFPPCTAAAIAEKEIQEITNKLRRCRLPAVSVRVIDDTALIETSLAGGKTKSGRKNPKPRDRSRRRNAKKPARVYSRQEMEALRSQSSDYEANMWAQVYAALQPAVAAEYDGLVSSPLTDGNHAAASPSRFRRRPLFQKSDAVAANGRRNHHNAFVR